MSNEIKGNAALLHYISLIDDMSKRHPDNVVNYLVANAFNTSCPEANFNADEIAASRKFVQYGRLEDIDIAGAEESGLTQAKGVVDAFFASHVGHQTEES